MTSVPKIGETQLGRLLGKSNTNRFVWSACKDCGKERWVRLRNGNVVYELCLSCASHRRKKVNCKTNSIIHFICPKCGKAYCIGWKSFLKWVRRHNQFLNAVESYQGTSRICRSCVMKEVGSRNIWKAIASPRKINHKLEIVTTQGYVIVYLSPDNPYYSMCHKGTVKKHRLVMAQSLCRCLKSWEIVHHKDGNKSNNDISNLEIHSQMTHLTITELMRQVQYLETKNRALKQELENARIYA
jgi:hypothetical protein